MKILHLTLKKKWFQRHLEDKPEDYRAITSYWVIRLLERSNGSKIPTGKADWIAEKLKGGTSLADLGLRARQYDVSDARNGYSANSPIPEPKNK